MENTKAAIKKAIHSGDCSCILIDKEGKMKKKKERGIGPLLNAFDEGAKRCMAGDKIIGKAAAMIFVLMEATFVYGEVMSQGAAEFLAAKGIPYECGTLTAEIRNRMDTGLCPMEQAVLFIEEPRLGVLAIRETLERMKRNAK